MPQTWNAGYVRCPYYISDDTRSRITCQGVIEGSKLHWELPPEDYKIQMREFCQNRYRNCEVCQLLSQIYEEDE